MKRRIKAVKLKYTALFREGADNTIKEMLLYIEDLIDKKHELFAQQQELEAKIDACKREMSGLYGLYEIVYEEEEDDVKEVEASEAPMIVESNGTIHG